MQDKYLMAKKNYDLCRVLTSVIILKYNMAVEKDIDSLAEDAVINLENAGFKNDHFHIGEQLFNNSLNDVAWSPDKEYKTFKLRFFNRSKNIKIKESHLDMAKDVLKVGAMVATAAAITALAEPVVKKAIDKYDQVYGVDTHIEKVEEVSR